MLDYCNILFPSSIARHNEFSLGMIECYYLLGMASKANAIVKEMFDSYCKEIESFISADQGLTEKGNLQLSMNILYDLSRLTNTTYPQGKFGRTILEKYSNFYRKINLISPPEVLK